MTTIVDDQTINLINEDNYWQAYTLTHDPFAADITGKPYYRMAEWESNLELVQHLCRYSNVLVSVTGPAGSGTTTFLQQCQTQIGEGMLVCNLEADDSCSIDKIVDSMITAFRLPTPNESLGELWASFEGVINHLCQEEQMGVLYIENAHLLSDDVIDSLLQLILNQSEGELRIHIMLFGESSLKVRLENLAAIQSRHDLIHCIELSPLAKNDLEKYLNFSLSASGYNGEFPFSSIELNALYKASRGSFRILNQEAKALLVEKKLQPVPVSTKYHTKLSWRVSNRKILLGFSALPVLMLGGAIIYAITPVEQNEQTIVLEKPVLNKLSGEDVLTSDGIAQNDNIQPVSEITEGNTELPARLALYLDEQDAAKEDIAPKIPAEQMAKVVESTQEASQTVKAVEQSIKTNVSRKEKSAGKHLSAAEKTILNMDKTKYTLQLIGMRNKNDIESFINAYQLKGKVTFFHTYHQNKDWFVVIYGEYNNQVIAKNAVKNLPDTLQKLRPWPRSFSSIHKSIRMTRKA